MESGDLRIFHAVATEGSVTKAATRLGYVQSNITARIQQLEAELETKLFYRQSRGMTLTNAGKNLLVYAEKILHMLNEAHQAVRDTSVPSGRLALGACPTAAAEYVPAVLVDYHKAYPRVDLSMMTGHSCPLVEQVARFELDGAFVSAPVAHPDVVEEVIFEEELVLITPPSESGPECVVEKPVLMNTTGCLYRNQIEEWLQTQGVVHPRMLEFNTLDAIIGGVMAGLGISLIPHSAVQKLEAGGLLKTFPVPKPYRSVRTAFIRHREALMTSAMNELIKILKNRAAAHGHVTDGNFTSLNTG